METLTFLPVTLIFNPLTPKTSTHADLSSYEILSLCNIYSLQDIDQKQISHF